MSQFTSIVHDGSIDVLISAEVSRINAAQHIRAPLKTGQCGASTTLIASLLSHDIRHQLSVVSCNAEFLSDAGLEESDRKQLFEEVKEAITDVTRMLDFILSHSKGDRPAEQAMESLREIIQRTVSAVRPHPHAEGVSITIGEFPSVSAFVNQTLVSSAVYNLLLNGCFAAQRGGKHGRVEITIRIDHRFVCILVKDNGPGVPVEVRQDLSKPFATRAKQKGAGLGITIAEYIARDYGGALQLESSSPGCTVFALKLEKNVICFAEAV